MEEFVIRLGKLKKIDETSVKVLKELQEELALRPEWISYTDIARRIGVSRNAVKYAIERMKDDGILKVVNGKLSLTSVSMAVCVRKRKSS